jgi:uncharacterized membrane protein
MNERTLGGLLRAGVILAAAVVVAGGIWYLTRFGGSHPDDALFRGEPRGLSSITGVVSGAVTGDPRYLIQLGLLLLIATPTARVALSVVMFAMEHDRLYVAITLVVLITLLATFVWPL